MQHILNIIFNYIKCITANKVFLYIFQSTIDMNDGALIT